MTMNRIKDILKEKGITQQELADRLGVTRSAIVKTLAGNPSQETLERIANILDVPMWQLFASPKEVSNIKGNNIEINCPHCNKIISLSIEIKDNDF
nr:MAG TPA: helix-turn-helix domain protein [Bacteriophage sp.]